MCGISGVFGDLSQAELNLTSEKMISRLIHRGPDHQDSWVGDKIALSSARLAISDPTPQANQPMNLRGYSSKMVFNGEIYNHKAIRQNLMRGGVEFQTNSDTEVVQKSLELMGVQAINEFNGMWAIAFWDPNKRQLTLSRDRFGKKPIYWTYRNQKFYFSSEIKSFKDIVGHLKPNSNYFSRFLRNEGVDAGEESPFEGIYSVPAGHNLVVSENKAPILARWWNTLDNLSSNKPTKQVNEAFSELFTDAVRIRIPTDQLPAVSLSAGLDSSAVFGATSLVFQRENSKIPIQAYTLSLPGSELDESSTAENTAHNFGGNLSRITMKNPDFASTVRSATWHQESLAWSPSLLAFHHYYKGLSENGVRVILEGHGSDEFMAGYPSFVREEIFRKIKCLKFRQATILFNQFSQMSNPLLGESSNSQKYFPLSQMVRPFIGNSLIAHFPKRNSNHIFESNHKVFKIDLIRSTEEIPGYKSRLVGIKGDLDKAVHYSMLPQILRVFDRASMAHSVESRAPFMDYRLIQFIFSLSEAQLYQGLGQKPFVRVGLSQFLTQQVKENQVKRGFAGDVFNWFKNPSTIRQLEAISSEEAFKSTNFIDQQAYLDLVEKSKYRNLAPTEVTALWRAYSYIVWTQLYLE
jgi:asparagine synthase (glutamine-hydrolysing)